MERGNREYKSDVFSMLLEQPENALSLFNAMNGSNYTDPSLVEICTLEKSVSLTVRNDASFIVDNVLSLYEHQSTVCPNMPLRILYYVSDILKRITLDDDIYGKRLIEIPTPRFAVFYNGTANQPEIVMQKLSDAFKHCTDQPELELVCKVYNINSGYNKKLFAKCRFLYEYMVFIEYVRENIDSYGKENLENALNDAIDRAITDNILKAFLSEQRSEVVKGMVLDYTYERRLELAKRDYMEEGRQEGRQEGFVKALVDLVKDGCLDLAEAAKRAKMTEEEFSDLIEKTNSIVSNVL